MQSCELECSTLEEVTVILDQSKRKRKVSFDAVSLKCLIFFVTLAIVAVEIANAQLTSSPNVDSSEISSSLSFPSLGATASSKCTDDTSGMQNDGMIIFSFIYYPLVLLADVAIIFINILVFCLGTGNNYWVFVPLSNNNCGFWYDIIFLVVWIVLLILGLVAHVLISINNRDAADICTHAALYWGILVYYCVFAILKAVMFADFGPIIWISILSVIYYFFYFHPCPNFHGILEHYFRSLKCCCCKVEEDLPSVSPPHVYHDDHESVLPTSTTAHIVSL